MELDPKDYHYWKRALAHIEAGVPQEARDNLTEEPCGFWRLVPARTKPSFPCSIYREKGQTAFVLQIGHRIRTLEPNDAEWQEFLGGSFLSSMPVDRAQWSAALESGWWPDGQRSRQMSEAEKLGVGPSGDNAAPDGVAKAAAKAAYILADAMLVERGK